MADVPVRFAGLRGTLAAFAVDLFAGRMGSLTDAPMCSGGYDRLGVYDGSAWRLGPASDYAGNANVLSLLVNGTSVIDSARNVKAATLWSGGAVRADANGDFSGRNQSLTGWLTVGGSARLGWGGVASGATQISSSSGFYASGSAIRWTRGLYFDGSNFINTSTEYAQIFRLDADGSVVIATQDNVPAVGEIANMSAKWTINRFGGMSAFGVIPPTTRPTVDAAATDLATVIALTNQLRSALIACGLVQ